MAETVLARLVAPTFPAGFCPSSLQAEWSEGIALTQVELLVNGAVVFYNFGDTTPPPENRIFPWLRTVAGVPDDWYVFAQGYWLSDFKAAPPHPDGGRFDYEGTEASLLTRDGGENSPSSLIAGPFWEIDHNYDGRIAMGAGVIADAVPSKTLSIGENYGEAAHLQLSDEVGSHTHDISSQASISHDGVVDTVQLNSSGSDDGLTIGGSGTLSNALTVGSNPYVDLTTGQVKLPLIPPVRGLLKIKRTIRRFKRVNP